MAFCQLLVEDAVEQCRRDRNPRERLFGFGRCVVQFAVDESKVQMRTELRGRGSWFLPFNKGTQDGAGNPPNPHRLKTDYLWKEVLTLAGLTDVLENYAQIVEEKDPRTGRRKRRQVWPRYHQFGVVRQALADVRAHGAGKRYLIQNSAGSGKSNSIAWLAHQLIGLKRRVWVGPLAGVTAESIGWPGFFLLSTWLAMPARLMLPWLRSAIQALDATRR